ncbi:MAG: hypothetical protein RLZZ381_2232 [Cyanobacteriota bacterium]|jgi:[ribosomal protein S5]-alanine N-acetyltransferase
MILDYSTSLEPMKIETTRCELTNLQSTDWDLVVKLYTNAEVRRFLGGSVNEKTISLRFFKMLESDTETQYWVIQVKENSSAKIGIVSLTPHHDNINIEISYQLLPEWWCRGYGTEAVQAVVTHALTVLGLPRVIAETQIANIASCRLLERIGMRLERTIERFGAKQGIFTT